MKEVNFKDHVAKHDFLIAIDSDGCAFDTMEVKHKECFIPEIIFHWGLQAVSKYVREAAEFVNLYSRWRGINRFPALVMVFDLLARRPEVQARGVQIPDVTNLRQWIETEKKLGNPALEAYCEEHSEILDMRQALRWSKAVNESIARMVKGIPPFPYVSDSLAMLADCADVMVCSATPQEALLREWEEHGLAEYPFAICGQEQGTKAEHIAKASQGRYKPYNILMIGDAVGDKKAAEKNGAHFYPICPGEEVKSWENFFAHAFGEFVSGGFSGQYENELTKYFLACLPECPPWERRIEEGDLV